MRIVCLGDSITAAFGLFPREMWVSLLNEETPDEWLNYGICGDTSAGMLARLSSEVFPLKPEVCILMGGGNDMLVSGSFEDAKRNMMGMVHQCAARGIHPVVGIAPPLLEVPEPWHPITSWQNIREVSEAWAAYQRTFCKVLGLRSVDFAAAFAAAPDQRALYQADGMHPNALGNRLMADTVLQNRFFKYQ